MEYKVKSHLIILQPAGLFQVYLVLDNQGRHEGIQLRFICLLVLLDLLKSKATCPGSTSSFKCIVGNMTKWGFQTLIISSISMLNIHGVLVVHLSIHLVGIVSIEWAGICTLLSFQVSPICDNIY